MYSMVTGQPAFTLPAPVGLARIAYGVAFLPGSAALAVAQDIYSSASSYSGATGQVAGAVTVFGFTGAYSTLALNAAGSLANNLNQLAAAALAPLPAGGVAFLAANQSPYMCGLPLSITLQSGCGFDPNNGESVTVWDVSQPVNAPPGSMTLSDSLRVIGWRGVSEDGTAALLAATRASASLLLWQVTSGPQARLLTTSTCAACVDASDVRVLQAGSAWGRVIVVGPFSRPPGVPTFPPGSVGSGSALVQVFRSIASTAGSQPAVATLLVNFDIFPAVDYVGNANKRVSVALSTDGAYLAATEGRHTLALWQLDAATAAGGSVAAPQQPEPQQGVPHPQHAPGRRQRETGEDQHVDDAPAARAQNLGQPDEQGDIDGAAGSQRYAAPTRQFARALQAGRSQRLGGRGGIRHGFFGLERLELRREIA